MSSILTLQEDHPIICPGVLRGKLWIVPAPFSKMATGDQLEQRHLCKAPSIKKLGVGLDCQVSYCAGQ